MAHEPNLKIIGGLPVAALVEHFDGGALRMLLA